MPLSNRTINTGMDKTESSVENIIDQLKRLDENIFEKDENLDEENRARCRMINIHLREFFDDIYIPYTFFKDGDWKISKVLYNNEDSLFFNEKYMTDDDHQRFYEVFDKYISVVEEILSTNNKLHVFLKKWTDTSDLRWKPNETRSYLKSLLVKSEYQIISPVYTANYFYELRKKHGDDSEKIKTKIEEHLDQIVKKVRVEMKHFKKVYNEIVESYVYEHPINPSEDSYLLGLINSVILAILDFADKLLNLNIYAVHPIVTNIIGYYTPLDEIYQYDPLDNDGRKLCIV